MKPDANTVEKPEAMRTLFPLLVATCLAGCQPAPPGEPTGNYRFTAVEEVRLSDGTRCAIARNAAYNHPDARAGVGITCDWGGQ